MTIIHNVIITLNNAPATGFNFVNSRVHVRISSPTFQTAERRNQHSSQITDLPPSKDNTPRSLERFYNGPPGTQKGVNRTVV